MVLILGFSVPCFGSEHLACPETHPKDKKLNCSKLEVYLGDPKDGESANRGFPRYFRAPDTKPFTVVCKYGDKKEIELKKLPKEVTVCEIRKRWAPCPELECR